MLRPRRLAQGAFTVTAVMAIVFALFIAVRSSFVQSAAGGFVYSEPEVSSVLAALLFAVFPVLALVAIRERVTVFSTVVAVVATVAYGALALLTGFSIGDIHLTFGVPLMVGGTLLTFLDRMTAKSSPHRTRSVHRVP